MNNQNHPFINALGVSGVSGNPSNIHILDNMLSFQTAAAADPQHKQLIPQYAYAQEMNLAAHHHAMNLVAAPHVTTVASTIDTAALYQSEHAAAAQQHQHQQHQQQQAAAAAAAAQQSQPISYGIPQIGGGVTVVTQEQPIQMSLSIPDKNSSSSSSKKDIVAEALREGKIFGAEEAVNNHHKKQQAAARAARQQQQAAAAAVAQQRRWLQQQTAASQSAVQQQTPVPAVKSEPISETKEAGEPEKDVKPVITQPTPGPSQPKPTTTTANSTSSSRPRQYNRVQARTQIMPRLQLLDDEDDGLTCRLCLQAFWYKNQLLDHLKDTHSITDPLKYEREEREKKLRRIREEQQRLAASKRQRMGAASYAATRGMSRGRGVSVSRGSDRGRGRGRQIPTGPRPSFQYRDGSFICGLCKKSFSDGNDMVSHWKSHVKQQARNMRGGLMHQQMMAKGSSQRTHMTSRGRPITSKQAGRPRGAAKAGRRDKGRPRWTAYLLWSTRRRKEITHENPEYTFAQVGKAISEGWKEVDKEQVEKLKEEAERLNANNIRKLPGSKRKDGSDSDSDSDASWSEEDDPSYDETHVKKPITLKIKREDQGRKRKRPSFFQDFENEENNLDKILDDFEKEQIEEAQNPNKSKPKPKPVKNPGSRPRRARQPKTELEDEGPVELETSRSGRVRKKPKFREYFEGDEDEDEASFDDEEDKDEYRPDSDVEEPEEEFVEEEGSGDEEANEGGEGQSSLPPKKRKKEGMSRKEIEEAMKAAIAAKPETVVVIEKQDRGATDAEDHQADLDVLTDATNGPNPDDYDNAKNPLDDVTLDTPRPAVPEDDDLDIGPSNSEVNPDVNPDDDKSKADPLDDRAPEETQNQDPTETAEPETTEMAGSETPERTEPDITEPERTEPETLEPDMAESERTEPETLEPDMAEPERTEPDMAEPERTEPETMEPDMAEPETVEESNPLEEKVEEEAQAEPSEDPFGAPDSQEEQNPLEEATEGTLSEEVRKEDTGLEVQDKDPVEPVGDPVSVPVVDPVVDGAEDDGILTSATDRMEEGDEQYKQMIAESQMDNIFN